MSINLAGLKKVTTKKAAAEKPTLPDPTGELTPLIAQCVEHKQIIDARTGALDGAKAVLGKAAFAHACQLYNGRDTKVEDTFAIGCAAAKALISLKNAYKVPVELGPVKAILGKNAGDVLHESLVIAIDADAMPQVMVQTFVDELVKLARSLDALLGVAEGEDGPIFQAISVASKTTVDKAFHERRYRLLSPEDNLRLQQTMPCVVSVRLDY